MALATQAPSRVSVSQLLQQLQVTQTELENIKVCKTPVCSYMKRGINVFLAVLRYGLHSTLLNNKGKTVYKFYLKTTVQHYTIITFTRWYITKMFSTLKYDGINISLVILLKYFEYY